jgi:hypothetical protein
MKEKKSKMFDQVCDFLGQDIDSEPCQVIQEHLQVCDNCEIFVDKIKKTVKVFQVTNDCEKIPDQVSKKLFAKLNLDFECQPKDDKK